MTQVTNSAKVSTIIDARGPRFGAAITTVVLAAALATNNVWFIVAQALVFAIGAFKGPQFTPYAFIYKTVVKPRLKGEVPTEEVKPPQFAQRVGLLFALVASCWRCNWFRSSLYNRSCWRTRCGVLERGV
jgi:hypothetical protein